MEPDEDIDIDDVLLMEDMGRLEQTIADDLEETERAANTPKKGNFCCSKCKKVYKIEKYFLKHVRQHTIDVLMKKAPNHQEFKNDFFDLCKTIVSAMKKDDNFAGEISERLRLFCCELEFEGDTWDTFVLIAFEEFYKIWTSDGKKIIFPSELRNVFLVRTNFLLNNSIFMSNIRGALLKHHHTSADIVQVFCGNLLLSLSEDVFVYVMRRLRGDTCSSSAAHNPIQDVESRGFRQILFHVSGFIVKQHLKLSFRYSKDVKWQEYGKAMRACFIEGDFVVSAENSDKSWTEAINRGGLTLVGEKAMFFFIPLVKLVLTSEMADGSLPVDLINAKVFDSVDILNLWDDLIGNVVSAELKAPLLLSVTKSLINACATGIIKRRLNTELAKGTTNVSFRPKLAPRQVAT